MIDLLPSSNVLTDLDVSSKKRVFEQVGLLFENNQNISRGEVFDSLFTREKLGSTGLGHVSRFPRRIKCLRESIGAFVRLKRLRVDAPEASRDRSSCRPGGDRFALAYPD